MSKMIQIRDVPDQVHAVLKARAALEGMSLSDFLQEGTRANRGAAHHARMAGTCTGSPAHTG